MQKARTFALSFPLSDPPIFVLVFQDAGWRGRPARVYASAWQQPVGAWRCGPHRWPWYYLRRRRRWCRRRCVPGMPRYAAQVRHQETQGRHHQRSQELRPHTDANQAWGYYVSRMLIFYFTLQLRIPRIYKAVGKGHIFPHPL